MIRSLVREPLGLFLDHHQPLVHSSHLLVKSLLLPSRSDEHITNLRWTLLVKNIPGDDLGQTVVMDKPIPILLVVDVKLGILPVVDNSAILSAAVIFGNNFTPLFPE